MRDLKVRYRQTAVGAAWALIQPLMTMVVFGVLFGLLKSQPQASDVPYAVTSLAGLIPWQLFATTVTAATTSIVMNSNLVQKVYFPRIILPISAFIPSFVDFCIAMLMLIGLMIWFQIVPTWHIVFLPVMVVLVMITSLAFSLWLSALNAIYRDIQYVVPFLIQTGLLISPVVYETAAAIPPQWRWLYSLNPMVGPLEGFRWALLGLAPPSLISMSVSMAGMFLLLAGGMFYFRRMERFFSDRI